MGEVVRLAQLGFGEAQVGAVGRHGMDAECAQHAHEHAFVGRLIERDADAVVADLAEVHALGPGGGEDAGLTHADLDRDRVEEGVGGDAGARDLERLGEAAGEEVDAFGDGAQPLGPVEDGVEGGHDGEKRLRGADVGGRLLAADMLFAGLEREAVGLVPARVDGDADDAAGHGALVIITAGHEGSVRAAITHGHAEPLGRADGDVGAHRAGFLEHGQGQKVRRDDGDGLGRVERGDGGGEVADMAVGAGVLQDRAEDL